MSPYAALMTYRRAILRVERITRSRSKRGREVQFEVVEKAVLTLSGTAIDYPPLRLLLGSNVVADEVQEVEIVSFISTSTSTSPP